MTQQKRIKRTLMRRVNDLQGQLASKQAELGRREQALTAELADLKERHAQAMAVLADAAEGGSRVAELAVLFEARRRLAVDRLQWCEVTGGCACSSGHPMPQRVYHNPACSLGELLRAFGGPAEVQRQVDVAHAVALMAHAVATMTGRFSASEPNVQSIRPIVRMANAVGSLRSMAELLAPFDPLTDAMLIGRALELEPEPAFEPLADADDD